MGYLGGPSGQPMNRAEPTLFPVDPDDAGAWPPGHRIGNFELQQALPRTGSARVYRAWDHGLARPVAVKEFLPAGLVHRDAHGDLRAADAAAAALFERGRQMFLDEARRLARSDHPALARVLHLLEMHGTAYCVMPWYAGRPVTDVPLALGGPLPEPALRTWLLDLVGALQAWHRVGAFHGGVHPGKTLLLADGHGLLLAPGAAARVAMPQGQAASGASFQPDEQLYPGEHRAPGPWTDFHALASVARYVMTGLLPPPPGQGPPEPLAATIERLFWAQPEVLYSPALLRTLDAALSPDIARRPRTAAHFLHWMGEETALQPSVPIATPAAAGLDATAEAALAQVPPARERVTPPARTGSLLEAAVEHAHAFQEVPPRDAPPTPRAVPDGPTLAARPDLQPEEEDSGWGDALRPGPGSEPAAHLASPEAPEALPETSPPAAPLAFPAPAPEAPLPFPAQAPAPTPAPAPAPSPAPAPAPAPAPSPSPSPSPRAQGPDEEEVDAATAALIRQLIDDIPPAPAPTTGPRRPRPSAQAAPHPQAPGLGAEGTPPPAPEADLPLQTAEPEEAPAAASLRAWLGDPRLLWAVAASVALAVAGATAWQLRPSAGLNVTGDDLPAITQPGSSTGPVPVSPLPVETPSPTLPATGATLRNEAPAAAPRARDNGPRQQCGSRTEFSLYRCMQQQCGQARWTKHAQCVAFRQTDHVE